MEKLTRTLASTSYCSVKVGAENCLPPGKALLSDAAASQTSNVKQARSYRCTEGLRRIVIGIHRHFHRSLAKTYGLQVGKHANHRRCFTGSCLPEQLRPSI